MGGNYLRNEQIQLLNQNNQLTMAIIQEILYVQETPSQSNFITFKETFFHYFDFDKFSELAKGHNFVKSNRGIFVNAERLRKYDQIDMWLYFQDHITENSIKAEVGQNYIGKFKKLLTKENSVDYNPKFNMRTLISQT